MPEKIGQSTPKIEGSIRVSTRVITANTTADTNDCAFFTTNAITLTLPQIAPSAGVVTVPSGFIYIFFNRDEANALTIQPNAADTINGSANVTLAADTGCLIMSDGVSDWEMILGAGT